jgi:hypothetical protein
MLRTADWKLVRRAAGVDELYHLASDPAERRNRIADPACSAILAELDRSLFARVLAAAPRTPALPAHGVEA